MISKEKLEKFFQDDIFAMDMGIKIENISDGMAVCSMTINKSLYNAGNVVQGGAVFTLADFTFAVAANGTGRHTVSQGANISFIRPGTGTKLVATAQRISEGKSTCLYSVTVTDDKDRKVAHVTVNGFVVGELDL